MRNNYSISYVNQWNEKLFVFKKKKVELILVFLFFSIFWCCIIQTCFLPWAFSSGAISPLSAAAAAAAAAGRVALSGSGVSGVLLASNLNEEVH